MMTALQHGTWMNEERLQRTRIKEKEKKPEGSIHQSFYGTWALYRSQQTSCWRRMQESLCWESIQKFGSLLSQVPSATTLVIVADDRWSFLFFLSQAFLRGVVQTVYIVCLLLGCVCVLACVFSPVFLGWLRPNLITGLSGW